MTDALPRFLSLEDMPSDAELIRQTLRRAGIEFEWQTVDSQVAFFQALAEFLPTLVFTDYSLPGFDGAAALKYVREHYPHIPVIVVTGALGEERAVDLMREGAVDYIPKSNLARLPEAVRRTLHHVRIEQDRTAAETALRASEQRLKRALLDSIASLASVVEMRDPYTGGHQQRVAKLAVAIATEMGLSDLEIDGLRLAATVHDIGKLFVPAEILSKPGRLSAYEYGIVEEHAQRGYEILRSSNYPWPIADIVHQHHERMDGTGYPQQLSGDEILLSARILSVADVVEAISSHRPYRPSLGIDAALEEIRRGRGMAFDPRVVDACLRLFQEKHYEL